MVKILSRLKSTLELAPAKGVIVKIKPAKQHGKKEEFVNEITEEELKLLREPQVRKVDGKEVKKDSVFKTLEKENKIQIIMDSEEEESGETLFTEDELNSRITAALNSYKENEGAELTADKVQKAESELRLKLEKEFDSKLADKIKEAEYNLELKLEKEFDSKFDEEIKKANTSKNNAISELTKKHNAEVKSGVLKNWK